mmetsp:Transcript_25384/g.45117  ORF Transcript_25384/g.45117 Transcript_25384/m.45117 type:complete len:355 (-) Transcript_25384:48-1112(-)
MPEDELPEEFRFLIQQWLACYPASRDAKAALRWIYANSEKYNFDTSKIATLGSSAGGFLANILANSLEEDFTWNSKDDPHSSTTNLRHPQHVSPCIDFCGAPDGVEALENWDGKKRFTQDSPPMLVIHGTKDETVPYARAEAFAHHYKNAGGKYKLCTLDGFDHCPWEARFEGLSIKELSFDWIVECQGLKVLGQRIDRGSDHIGRIFCFHSNEAMHIDGIGDKLASTRYRGVEDEYTGFLVKKEGKYHSFFNVGNGLPLAVDGDDKILSTRNADAKGEEIQFVATPVDSVKDTYRLRSVKTGLLVHCDCLGDNLISTRFDKLADNDKCAWWRLELTKDFATPQSTNKRRCLVL